MFCGGLDSLDQERSECWELDSNKDAWRIAPSLHQATAYAAHATVEERFYVVGGWYRNNAVDTLQIFANGKWSLGTSIPTARYGACAVAYLNYIVVVGGWKSLKAQHALESQKTIEVYSISRKKWKSLDSPDKFRGLSTSSCASLSNSGKGGMILIGGITYTKSSKSIEAEVNDGVDILTFGGKNGRIGFKKSGGVSISWQAGLGWVDDWLLLAGGRGPSEKREKGIFRWKEGRTWEQFGNLEVARDQAASLVLSKRWDRFTKNCTQL